MNAKILPSLLVLVSGLCTHELAAQTPRLEFPAPSPTSTLKQHAGLTDIEIVYSRPGAKGRQVYGGIVPFGEVWRTGANASTKISFSTDVKVNGTAIPAGKYALYTIPNEKEWTIIIYKDTSLNGSTGYAPSNDLARIKATPAKLADSVETFTMDISDIRDDSAVLNLIWEKTRVPVKLEFDLTSKLVPQIEAAMAGSGERKPYYQAAMFYYDHNQDLAKASQWIDAAIAEREAHYMVHLKAKILAKRGDKAGATAAAKRSSELAIKAEGPKSGYVKMNDDLIASLR